MPIARRINSGTVMIAVKSGRTSSSGIASSSQIQIMYERAVERSRIVRMSPNTMSARDAKSMIGIICPYETTGVTQK